MFVLEVLLLCLIASSAFASEKNGRIFGGTQVQPGELAYNALIEITAQQPDKSVKSSCGSIISAQWILTSASSVQRDSSRPGAFQVIVGKYDLLNTREGSEQAVGVRKVICHGEFDEEQNHNDIALLWLSKSLGFNDYVQPVALETNAQVYPTGLAAVSGYGTIRADGSKASYLTKWNVNILAPEVCIVSIGASNLSLFCTDPATCEGDFGAPLVQQRGDLYVQIGVMSSGTQCVFFGPPTYYTHVARYVNWINETVTATVGDDPDGAVRPMSGVLLIGALFTLYYLLQYITQ